MRLRPRFISEETFQIIWQAFCLSLFTLLAVSFMLVRVGPNVVTVTYASAATRFWAGISPYLPPTAGDWFKYSPFFAMIYRPISLLPPTAHVLTWAWINAFVFWWGMMRWFPLRRDRPWWFWVGLVLASMEMDGSIRYQQMNALLVGLTLLGLSDYRDGRFGRAGAILCFATNLKLLPALFLLPLGLRALGAILAAGNQQKSAGNFLLGAFLMGLVALVAPMLVHGIWDGAHLHDEWLRILKGDVANTGLLDLVTVLQQHGLVISRAAVAWPILALTLWGLTAKAPGRGVAWAIWTTLGFACLLLTNPRTESPTFVLISPVYVFLLEYFSVESKERKWLGWGIVFVAGFLVTLSFNDVWPKFVWNPHDLRYATKTWGVFLLWVLSATELLRSLRQNRPF